MVPFNLRGLFDLMGGNARVVQRLDNFFTQLDAGPDAPYAFLGNEPSLGIPWEYDYAGAPYKTQHIVHTILTTLYGPGPAGLPGNEDLGELSSWFIFAALGMYPALPGTANLVLASPLSRQSPCVVPAGRSSRSTLRAPQAARITSNVCWSTGGSARGPGCRPHLSRKAERSITRWPQRLIPHGEPAHRTHRRRMGRSLAESDARLEIVESERRSVGRLYLTHQVILRMPAPRR